MLKTQQLDEGKRHELMRINGQLPSMQFYSQLFAMNLENELSTLAATPLLLVHGEQDPRVQISHSEKYYSLRNPNNTRFLRLKTSDHDFNHPEEKEQAIATTVDWFSETLR